jgi:hypothetical protein
MEILSGDSAYQAAQRRATYSNYDWIVWKEHGEWHAARRSSAVIKRAMLAVGTQGVSGGLLKVFAARTPCPLVINWWTANNMRRYSIRQERGEL